MLSSPGLHTAAARLQDTDKPALIGSYNRIKWTAGAGRLHGEDAAARSALIPLPAQPPLTAVADSPPGSRFNQGDGAEMRVNTSSQLKDKPRPPPPPPPPPSFSAAVGTKESLSSNKLN